MRLESPLRLHAPSGDELHAGEVIEHLFAVIQTAKEQHAACKERRAVSGTHECLRGRGAGLASACSGVIIGGGARGHGCRGIRERHLAPTLCAEIERVQLGVEVIGRVLAPAQHEEPSAHHRESVADTSRGCVASTRCAHLPPDRCTHMELPQVVKRRLRGVPSKDEHRPSVSCSTRGMARARRWRGASRCQLAPPRPLATVKPVQVVEAGPRGRTAEDEYAGAKGNCGVRPPWRRPHGIVQRRWRRQRHVVARTHARPAACGCVEGPSVVEKGRVPLASAKHDEVGANGGECGRLPMKRCFVLRVHTTPRPRTCCGMSMLLVEHPEVVELGVTAAAAKDIQPSIREARRAVEKARRGSDLLVATRHAWRRQARARGQALPLKVAPPPPAATLRRRLFRQEALVANGGQQKTVPQHVLGCNALKAPAGVHKAP
mmetsp:Transcript_11759/g.30187  ORF Transcript_11759/g.30187 Transcript_11759/m.30187 type:complete len:433 (-) Transcript_11759:57-1355(-)